MITFSDTSSSKMSCSHFLSSCWFIAIIAIFCNNLPSGQCLNIPSLALPSTLPPLTVTTAANPLYAVNDYANGVSNAACEINPTGLLCGTSVAVGHAVLQNVPANATWRHCSVFTASPHCCAQFCPSGAGGNCDAATGACMCGPNPKGYPSACQLLVNSETRTTSGMTQNDLDMLSLCKQKCAANTNGCKSAAAATDGIVGTVCFCYCPPDA